MAYDEIKPVGNDYLETHGTALFYETKYEHAREFAYCFGLLNNKGGSETSNLQDKCLMYLGATLDAGGGDTWLLNGVLTALAGVTRKNIQWGELDANIHNGPYGATPGVMGLAAPAAYLLTFNGFSSTNYTGVLLFSQAGAGKAYRNITFANGCLYSGIENYDSMEVLFENNGAPGFVLRSRGPVSKMQVNGEVGFGDAPIPGIAVHVYRTGNALQTLCGSDSAAFRLADYGAGPNIKYVDWHWDGGCLNLIAYNDNGTLRACPLGVDTVNQIIRPSTDNAVMLGHDVLRWSKVLAYGLSLKPPSSATPSSVGELTIEATDDTLTFRRKRADGTIKAWVLT